MTGPFGTTSGPYQINRNGGGSFDLFGKTDDGYTVQIGEIFDEDMDVALPALRNARAIAQVPAMLALVEAMRAGPFTPVNWVEMARNIARELEVK